MSRVMMIANSSWNLQHFRKPVVHALLGAGHEITTVSPDPDGIVVDGHRPAHRRWAMHRSRMNPFAEFATVAALATIVRQERPEVILSYTIKPNIYGGLAARLNAVPTIPNVSGLGSSFIKPGPVRQALQRMYKLAFSRSPRVFFQNHDDERLFVTSGTIRASQAGVLPGSGINLDHFAPAPLPPLPRFVMIARLLRDKGVREYVHAAEALKSRVPESSFALVGDLDRANPTGISEDELRQWVADGAIDYLGPAEDVRPFILDASAVVLPSYREGLPRALLEGAAMGRPLIACDVPGCRAVVRHGITGFLAEVRSAKSLADAMEQLASLSHEARTELGARARKMVEEEFDERIVAQAYLDAVAEACGGTSSPTKSSPARARSAR